MPATRTANGSIASPTIPASATSASSTILASGRPTNSATPWPRIGSPTQQIDGLILDLRYNRGGLLEAARDVCDMLLDKGDDRHDSRPAQQLLVKEYEAEPGVELPAGVPIVVLVDRLSASASEIVAAALQDNHRAVVAGQRTWGKGTVQNVIKLEGGKSAIRLTVGSYHRPSGKEIHKWKGAKDSDDWGVRPDAGLESLLTNQQNELIILARRKRDFLPWDDSLAQAIDPPPDVAANSDSPSPTAPPIPEPEAETAANKKTTTAESELPAAATKDPATIDPQLRTAIEYLPENRRSHAPAGASVAWGRHSCLPSTQQVRLRSQAETSAPLTKFGAKQNTGISSDSTPITIRSQPSGTESSRVGG